MAKYDIRDLTIEELKLETGSMGEAPHRALQLFLWLNKKGADDFDSMTDLPKMLIKELKEKFIIGRFVLLERLISKDGTEKFLWELHDGVRIETVLIKSASRVTLCISTQAGCRFACSFCASGGLGFRRNLTPGEITGQIIHVHKLISSRVSNIVFMGMGEPLDNFDNLVRAIKIINHPSGIGIGARKITVSTCGIVPGILKLMDIGIQVELSVSLHAADDKLRDELVPANRKYPLDILLKACREYYEKTSRVITFEYVLIAGKNDSPDDAIKLAEITKNIKGKVNIIPLNCFGGGESQGAVDVRAGIFRKRLKSMGVNATIRVSKGADILAACGQLAAGKHGKKK